MAEMLWQSINEIFIYLLLLLLLLSLLLLLLLLLLSLSDVNECANGLHACNQLCNNTMGSYKCSCYDGYMLDQTKASCIGKILIIKTASH